MTEPSIAVAVVWSDVDLLEVELRVQFDAWCGAERAYVTRKELAEFATALDQVAVGKLSRGRQMSFVTSAYDFPPVTRSGRSILIPWFIVAMLVSRYTPVARSPLVALPVCSCSVPWPSPSPRGARLRTFVR